MILKFGLLVLLLIQESTFAAKRQLSLSVVETASVGQNLRQLRIRSLQMFHSKVQSPLSNEFAGLIKISQGDCAWDVESKKCSLSISRTRKLLERSDTELAKILVERCECLELDDKWLCDKRMKCLWNGGMDECSYVDVRRGHEDSPCAKAAPSLFDYDEAIALCQRQDNKTSCETERLCEWRSSDEYGSCLPDHNFIFYGVKNFQKKIHKASPSLVLALRAEFRALQSSDNFTWQSLLDYKPRYKDCPSDVEPVVCDYLVTFYSGLFSRSFYCSGKYESAASDCRADALCVWNVNLTKCKSDEDLALQAAGRSARKILIDSMPEGTVKRAFEASFACDRILEEGSCNETCIWNPIISKCLVKSKYVAAIYTEPGKNCSDALCSYLAVTGFSDCLERFTKAECERTELCGYNAYGYCTPKEEYYLSKAAELDPALRERYIQVKRRCSRHKTQSECVKNKDFSSKDKLSTWAS